MGIDEKKMGGHYWIWDRYFDFDFDLLTGNFHTYANNWQWNRRAPEQVYFNHQYHLGNDNESGIALVYSTIHFTCTFILFGLDMAALTSRNQITRLT